MNFVFKFNPDPKSNPKNAFFIFFQIYHFGHLEYQISSVFKFLEILKANMVRNTRRVMTI